MALYVISYDLHKIRIYQPLVTALRAAGAVEALESFWLADLSQTADQVRDAVMSHIDGDDSVLVIEVKPGSWWSGFNISRPTQGWLRGHLMP